MCSLTFSVVSNNNQINSDDQYFNVLPDVFGLLVVFGMIDVVCKVLDGLGSVAIIMVGKPIFH